MTSKISEYREALRSCTDWPTYLIANSNLPGPRGNLELAEAAYQEGTEDLFQALLAMDGPQVEENTAMVFGVFCGVLGLGKPLGSGNQRALALLKCYANDPRWRIREAVAMALQKFGQADTPALLVEMHAWAGGSWLERRAVVAGLCEPGLLQSPAVVQEVLSVLDEITGSLAEAEDRKNDAYRTLRQALGYGWSVAAAADFKQGKPAMERWLRSPDPDVRWLMKENLKKNRLIRLDKSWVDQWAVVINCA